ELLCEAPVTQRRAGAAAEIRAMTSGAGGVVAGRPASRLDVGVNAVGDGGRALLRVRNETHEQWPGHHEGAKNVHRQPQRPGCGGLMGSHETTPVRLVSRRKIFPPCVTYSHARPGPP